MIAPPGRTERREGLFLAVMGIPASGKSTLALHLALAVGGVPYLEPEEEAWPAVVLETPLYGQFECAMWFRSTRVPMYLDAARVAQGGKVAVIDSVWDKLFLDLMPAPCMHWALALDNPYFAAAKAIAAADRANLPDPDAIIYISVAEAIWRSMLIRRGRRYDTSSGLAEHYGMEALMQRTVREYCEAAQIPLILFRQQLANPRDAAIEVMARLRTQRILRAPLADL